jgi:ferredoxin
MASEMHHRFELNAPGPFYTTGGCTACGAPEDAAPDLLAPLDDNNYHTYFLWQPVTPDEVERACHAAEVCCVSALRYGGTDPGIIRRLGNRSEFCDHVLPGGPTRMAWESDAQWKVVRNQWERSIW